MRYAEIESFVMEALKLLLDEGVRELRPYAGELTAEAAEECAYRMPAVFVHVADMRRNPVPGPEAWYGFKIVFYVADRALRGSGNASGCYGIVERIRELLRDKRLGGQPFELESERVIGVTRATALMEAVYRLRMLIREV